MKRDHRNVIQSIIDAMGAKHYLEIGISEGTNFVSIKCDQKIGADPIPPSGRVSQLLSKKVQYFQKTSDLFFSEDSYLFQKKKFDVVFIDGLHEHKQVLRDIENSLRILSKKGVIVVHNCSPWSEAVGISADSYEEAGKKAKEKGLPWTGAWTGDVWKAIANIRTRKDISVFTLDADTGIAIITQKKNKNILEISKTEIEKMQYQDLERRRKEILHLKPEWFFPFFLREEFKKKLNIVFAHSALPNQFYVLHEYLLKNGIANSYMFCSEGARESKQFEDKFLGKNIYSFVPDGGSAENVYYFSGLAEKGARISLGFFRTIKKMFEKKEIDLIVAHGCGATPHFLFDEINIPIISYIEFPSYLQHSWDKNYPPQDGQRYSDKNFEMLSYFQAIKSDIVLTPSEYAKNMFPKTLQENIVSQMEGFEPEKIWDDNGKYNHFKGKKYIGYVANGLGSAKGFDQFIKITKAISERDDKIQFVIAGDPNGPAYSFEKNLIDSDPKTKGTSFKDYIMKKEGVDPKKYIFLGKLSMEDYSSFIHNLDVFLYPLQFGSATWGFYELFLRGKKIIASNRCFLPEVVKNGVNGFLLPYEDVDSWATLSLEILNSPQKYEFISQNAKKDGEEFYIQNIAPKYLKIFEKTIENFLKKKLHHFKKSYD